MPPRTRGKASSPGAAAATPAPDAPAAKKGKAGAATARAPPPLPPPPPPPPKKTLTAFVTVGTTRFDALVAAADDPAFAAALVARDFTHLAVQAGAGGDYKPHRLLGEGVSAGVVKVGKKRGVPLSVEFFAYAPSLADRMAAADLVISHAGAGSVFEALRLRKPLVAVPNPALMGDHQGELARSLSASSHAAAASPATLAGVVRELDLGPGGRVPWVAGSPAGIVAALDGLAGRTGGKKKGLRLRSL